MKAVVVFLCLATACGGGSTTSPADAAVDLHTAQDEGAADAAIQPDLSFAALTVSTTTIAFGNAGGMPGFVACGTTPAPQTFSVTNAGTTSVEWWATFGSGSSSTFALSVACTEAAPCTIAPGAAPTIVTVTAPAVTTTGGLAAIHDTVTISSSIEGFVAPVITLSEQPYGAVLAVNPTDVNFGGQPATGTYTTPVEILNTGNAAAPGVTLTTTGSSEFSTSVSTLDVPVTGTSSGSPFNAIFAPAGSADVASAQVALEVAAGTPLCASPPANLTLEGQGTKAIIGVPTTVSFNSGPNGNGGKGVSCGATGPTEHVTVTNTGTLGASITGLALTLGASSPYTLSTVCTTAAPCAVNASSSFDIVVVPKAIPTTTTAGTTFNDTLTVTTTTGAYTVALQETAAGATLQFTNTVGQAISVLGVSFDSSTNFSLSNRGNVSITFDLSLANDPENDFSLQQVQGLTLAPSTNFGNAALYFPTSDVGGRTATVSFSNLESGVGICGSLPMLELSGQK